MANIKKSLFYTRKFILLFIPLFLGFVSPVHAVNVTLQWSPNSDSNLAGYRVFSREEGQFYDYTNPSVEIAEALCNIYNLDENKTYYFVVRAFDTKGVESGDSNEVCLEAATTPNNQPPIAVIAEDYIEVISGTTVALDGSRSTDADDGIASYHWRQVDGPSVTLSDNNSEVVTFTAPDTDQYGSNLTFQLTLTDFGGLQSTADCSVYIALENEPATVILEAHFDNNKDGFSYVDDSFRNSSQPGYADGVWIASSGFIGGALQIALGGIDNAKILDMSGGWQQDFSLSIPTDVVLSFRYKLTQTPDYENDELSQLLVSVDHILYGKASNDYVVQIRGNGNGGSSENTGWQLFELNLGIFAAGDHTLTIGGYNNKKTYSNESTEVLIDNVLVKSFGGSNQAPDVNAGSDQTIILPAATVVLDATCTDDYLPNGTLNFQWSQVSGPGTVTFGDVGAEDTTAKFPASGLFVLRLTADDTELFTSDDIQVTVSAEPINLAPVVNAGSDQTITLPVDNVLLEASVTDDGLPTGVLTTVWSQLSGPANQVVFDNAYAIQTTATFLSAGTYVLQLTADDGELTASDGLSDSETITVTVLSPVTSMIIDNGNSGTSFAGTWYESGGEPPIGDDNLYSNSPGSTYTYQVSINGYYEVYLHWTYWSNRCTSAPIRIYNGTQLVGYETVDQKENGSQWNRIGLSGYNFSGTARVVIEATSTSCTTCADAVKFISAEPINLAPVVNAGSDQTITLPVDNVLLEASVTDDGLPTGVLTTVWSQLSGPVNQVVFDNAYAIQTTATFLSAGTYVLQLTADDGELTASDQVTINVIAGSSPPSTCVLDSQFQQAILARNITYYTDRSYKLTSVPSKYIGMDMIKTPNSDLNLTVTSDYLMFEMPYDGIVYVAFDSRATSLPSWMSGFSKTGDRIYTSLRSQPYLNVYKKSYSRVDCVNFGANKAPGFSGNVVSNYIVFW
jgi:K319L-like, PKD domain/Fibronectin type III domain